MCLTDPALRFFVGGLWATSGFIRLVFTLRLLFGEQQRSPQRFSEYTNASVA